MSSMKAVQLHVYGGNEVLSYGDAALPVAGAGEVLVRIHATSVNPLDCAVHTGFASGYFEYELPLIPGTDVSGVVEAVGADVGLFRPGDRVYGRAGGARSGAYAEFAAVPAADLAFKPASLDHVHAAAVPHAALTAWQALYIAGGLAAGQRVLIHGAAGGVGHMAVQLAQLRGAKVIGTASINLQFLEELGVDQAVDYSATAFEDVIEEVDIVVDTVGGDTQDRSWDVLKPGGILVSTAQPPSRDEAEARGVRQAFVGSVPPIGEVLAQVAALIDNGKLTPEVSHVFPLHEIRRAHDLVESRHTRGKIALLVAG